MSDGSEGVSRRSFLKTGAGATAVATATGTATAQEGGGGGNVRPVWPDYVGDANDEGYEDLRGQSEVTITVDSNYFAPTRAWVDPGTEVTWEFAAAGHNVKPNTQPGSDLEGTEGGRNETVSSGSTYEATLESGGMYSYFCGPHETIGMKGAIAVGNGVETEQIGGGGGGGPALPDAAKSLGVATMFAMAATLGLAYFFIKYGGDYGEAEEV